MGSLQTYLGDSLAIQTHHNATERLVTMLDVKVDLDDTSQLARTPAMNPIMYLVGDLRATRLSLLSLDQGKADGKDQEKGQKKVAEIHGCELPLKITVE